jgi:hypothetical protein
MTAQALNPLAAQHLPLDQDQDAVCRFGIFEDDLDGDFGFTSARGQTPEHTMLSGIPASADRRHHCGLIFAQLHRAALHAVAQ